MTTVANSIPAKSVARGIHPENELLLCCARTCVEPEIAHRISRLLRQNINWRRLVAAALGHGVMPLLYQSLNTTCPEAVPTSILAQLRNHFHTNTGRNLFLAD